MDEKEKAESAAKPTAKTETGLIPLIPDSVTKYVNPLATREEVAIFLNLCAKWSLDPFARDVYLIKYSAKEKATIVVGYETYLRRANRSGLWAGLEDGIRGEGDKMVAWAQVYRKDWQRPLYHEVKYSEYAQYKDEWAEGQKTGRKILTRFWAEKPETMLKKVAIAQAIRMAFPEDVGGMPYIEEEVPDPMARRELEVAAEVLGGEETWKAPAPTAAAPSPIAAPKPPAPLPPELYLATKLAEPEKDPLEEAEHGEPPADDAGLCSLVDLAKFSTALGGMRLLGFDQDRVYAGLKQKLGRDFAEPTELTAEEMEKALTYLNNWRHVQLTKNAAAKAAKK